jgi:2-dehydropantoate 2-reductase
MGNEAACREIADLLKRGGLRPVVKKPGFGRSQASVSVLFSSFVAGLELSGWSLKSFRRGPWLKHSVHGTREGVYTQLRNPSALTRGFVKAFATLPVFSLATHLMPLLFPFDIEKYLEFHFTKVRDQTLHLLDLYAKDGMKHGRPVEHIQTLRKGLLEV